jgi:hypothetical protein
MSDEANDDAGDFGGGSRTQRMKDCRLVERAIAESWPIPDKLRPRLIKRLARIMMDRDASPREATSAAKALLSASKINLESIATAMKAQEHEELVERIEELEGKAKDVTPRSC